MNYKEHFTSADRQTDISNATLSLPWSITLTYLLYLFWKLVADCTLPGW